MSATPARYLLCRPAGGLNDMLCQIGKCANYAERHGRTLVIHTAPVEFGESLESYFEPLSPGIVFATPHLLADLEKLAVYPSVLAGQINAYLSQYSGEYRNYVLAGTREKISLDFGKDYAEPLLVHHACGGGLLSLDCLGRFKLNPGMVEKFYARIEVVGRHYAGVHVRHTDYRTDYVEFFNVIADKIRQEPIVVCTDNREVADHAKAFFGPRAFGFADLPDMGGRPLHYDNQLDRQTINTDSILDLITLARARRLFVTPVSGGHFSGYSRLALALNRNQALVDQLLGRGRFERPTRVGAV
jgi:hypothetical protein